MNDKIDIVALIKNNPLIKLGDEYQDKFLNKIKSCFSDEEQRIFVASFYMYLNFEEDEFVIDMDNIWKWLGFGRKQECKRVLMKVSEGVKMFTENADYILFHQTVEKYGRPDETIMMTIDTFKQICLMSKTKKAREIHQYYIKMEKVLHETLKEESIELRNRLQLKDKELQETKQELKDIINKKETGWFYIAIDESLKDTTKIGISKNAIRRRDQHSTSNIKFTYIFTHKSENYKEIEKMMKILCKEYLTNKDKSQSEWYDMTHEEIKKVFDFVCMMYDEYSINASKSQLLEFVNRWKKNKVSQITNTTFFTDEEYDSFFRENIVFSENAKVPFCMLLEEFKEWSKDSKILTPSGNTCTKFIEEYMKNIYRYTNSDKTSINLIDASRNYNYSKYPGYLGFELKKMSELQYVFFTKEQYLDIIKSIFQESTTNIDSQSVIKTFINYTQSNNISPKKKLYPIPVSFKLELKREILGIFKNSSFSMNVRIQSRKYSTSGYKNLSIKW